MQAPTRLSRRSRGHAANRMGSMLVGLASCVVLSCTRPATQLVVVVHTDLTPGTDFQCIGILVSRVQDGRIEPGATRRFLAVPEQTSVPFSFGVTAPDGDPARRVEVAVEALERCEDPPPGARVVRRAIRTGFLAQELLRLPLFLSRACGDGCTPDESCPVVGDDCVPVPTVEPEELMQTRGGEELLDDASLPQPDASAGPDAGPCGTFGDTLAISREPEDTLVAATASLEHTLEPGASHEVELWRDGMRLRSAASTGTASFDALDAGAYEMRVIARLPGCGEAEVTSRTFTSCATMWDDAAITLPASIDDGTLAVAGDLAVLFSSSGRLMTIPFLTDGTLGTVTSPALSAVRDGTRFDSTGLASAAARLDGGEHRIWLIGGLGGGGFGRWVRSLRRSGAGSLEMPPVAITDEARDLPRPVESHAAVVVGRWLLVLGGTPVTRDVAVAEIDLATGELLGPFRDQTVLPHGCDNCAAAVLDGSVYLAGGRDEGSVRRDTVTRVVVNLDTGDLVAEEMPVPLPEPRDNHALVVDPGARALYVIGGRDASGDSTATVFRTSIDTSGRTGEWHRAPELPAPVAVHEAAFAAPRIHVFADRRGFTARADGPGGSLRCPAP